MPSFDINGGTLQPRISRKSCGGGEEMKVTEKIVDAAWLSYVQPMDKIYTEAYKRIAMRAALEAAEPMLLGVHDGHTSFLRMKEWKWNMRANALEAAEPMLLGVPYSWAKFIAANIPLYHKDWACKACAPESEMIVEGFSCIPHQAKAMLDAAPSPMPEARK